MRLIVGDCLHVLASIPEGSMDACVTDPPYELGFMGKAWDRSGIAFREDTWRAVGRVLKPGAHLLAFGGTRTFHRIACAIEDAGFEIRDCLCWLQGQGFPKSLDVSKAIDEAAGLPREKVNGGGVGTDAGYAGGYEPGMHRSDKPNTATAAAWSGWGTALKPAWESITLARKPLVGTVAENVLRHGTGGINVEACRLDPRQQQQQQQQGRYASSLVQICGSDNRGAVYPADLGRWPANVCLDEEAAAMLDEQSGDVEGMRRTELRRSGLGYNSSAQGSVSVEGYGDSGGASRFF